MNNKPFEQWWAGLRDVGEKKLVKAIDLEIEGRSIHVDEAEARELHAQIIEAADYAMPCTIMRRFSQLDDSPLGCYVPVAYCDNYGLFEELIEAAGKPHALICVQRQERPKPKAEPKPTEPTEATEDEDKPYIVEMRFPGEKWIERGRFDTPEEANLFTHEDGAFAPPGQRKYRVRRSDEKPEPEPEPELGHLQGASIALESRGEIVKVIALDKIHEAIRQANHIIIHTDKGVEAIHFSSEERLQRQWDEIQRNISARGEKPEPEPVDDAVPSGKSYESVDAMLKDQGAHDTRAELLSGEVDILRKELNAMTEERDKLAKRLEEYGTEIAHLRSQQLDEGQRQLIIMGLADCVLNCPGFEYACREVAEHLNGVVMFDHFKVTRARYKTPPPSDETPIPVDPS